MNDFEDKDLINKIWKQLREIKWALYALVFANIAIMLYIIESKIH